jgi:hypothetical protein
MINNTMDEDRTSTRDVSTINNTMDEGNTSTGTDKIYLDLNECPIENIVAKDVFEVDELETYEKENVVPCSQNIEINGFVEEVDKNETYSRCTGINVGHCSIKKIKKVAMVCKKK